MDDNSFLVVAVVVGGIVIGTVLWRYLRMSTQGEPALSTTLVLVGFLLVSTPLWAAIVVKGPQWEVSLLKQQNKGQAVDYLKLLEAYSQILPPEEAEKLLESIEELDEKIGNVDQSNSRAEQIERINNVAEAISEVTQLAIML